MPVTPTYPGVYVEEIPSGVRTITGVATSITAFIGRALRGPVNSPTRIQSFGDYERAFGGLWFHSTMSYAVRQFFQNGGADALIVRLTNGATDATVNLPIAGDALTLVAGSNFDGDNGNNLRVTVTHNTGDTNLFTLEIGQVDTSGNYTVVATFTDVSIDSGAANFVTTALSGSSDVNVQGTAPGQRPAEFYRFPFSGGDTTNATNATASLSVDSLTLSTTNEGSWGNNLWATIDNDTIDPTDTAIFNLTIAELDADGNTVGQEVFRNLSLDEEAARYIVKVLEDESNLAETTGTLPTADPAAITLPFSGGSDGSALTDSNYQGSQTAKTGLYVLEDADLFNLLYIPAPTRGQEIGTAVLTDALQYCQSRRAMLLIDPRSAWNNPSAAESGINGLRSILGGAASINAIAYFPALRMPDPLQENRAVEFGPGGAVAGIISRTDATRGVWKAPAGIDATFSGARQMSYKLTDDENGRLNPLGLNCLRTFPTYGQVVWGARTLAGDDRLASEWKYVPVRRMALFLEESLYRGLHWVVFEPNDESLWAQIRLNVGAFMQNLFRQGAFQGSSPREAYFVKCDRETTTQNDINLGIVNIVVGFAPLKPAEFVIIKLQQIAGQIEV